MGKFKRVSKEKRKSMVRNAQIFDFMIEELATVELKDVVVTQKNVIAELAIHMNHSENYIQHCLSLTRSKYCSNNCSAFYNGQPKSIRHVTADCDRIKNKLYNKSRKNILKLADVFLYNNF